MTNDKGWIGVDLDGTLAFYEGFVSIHHIGAPIVPMLERVKDWLAKGEDVRIFTARACPVDPKEGYGTNLEAIKAIEAWCLEHVGRVLPVTYMKDFKMVQLWDDRAVQVVPNKGVPYVHPDLVPQEPTKTAPPAGFEECHYCHGTGKVQYRNMKPPQNCTACGGSGTLARRK